MKTKLRAATAAAALLATLALPLGASATTTGAAQSQHYTIETRLFDRFNAGEFDGVLSISVSPAGIVQGTYRDASAGGFHAVTGSVDTNHRLWLDIGMARPLRLYGTFDAGTIAATAQIPGPDVYTFESTKVTNS